MKTAAVLFALTLPLAARASDIPTAYTVDDKVLKAAVAGTNLTFTLYRDAACTQQVHQQVVPIETVTLVSRLKNFVAKGAPKGPKTTELRQTLAGVDASGNLYLKVTGTGVTAVGGACQVQVASQPPAPVVKDANGTIIGTYVGQVSIESYVGQVSALETLLRRVGGKTVGIPFRSNGFVAYPDLFFDAPGCTGNAFTWIGGSTFAFSYGEVVGTTLYQAAGPPGFVFPVSYGIPGGNCGSWSSVPNYLSPASAAPFPAFTPPFHVEVP